MLAYISITRFLEQQNEDPLSNLPTRSQQQAKPPLNNQTKSQEKH
jgi:hypothetical protein